GSRFESWSGHSAGQQLARMIAAGPPRWWRPRRVFATAGPPRPVGPAGISNSRSHMTSSKPRLTGPLLLLLVLACSPRPAPEPPPAEYLHVWTASADSTQPDFLAVLDVTEDS